MMKKLLVFVLTGMLIVSSAINVYAKQDKREHGNKVRTEAAIKAEGETENQVAMQTFTEFKAGMTVKGKKVNFDVPPVIKDGRTLIPVRAVMNSLNAKVEWDPATQTVTITKGDIVIKMILGESKVFVNGKEVTLDVPAMLVSDRTVVPLRFISEALGEKVNYDDKTGEIDIEDDENSGTNIDEESNTQTKMENESDDKTVSQDVYTNTNDTVSNSVYSSDDTENDD